MFDKLSNSWQLVKASWAVLRADKELLLFPVMSSIVMIITFIVFLLPVGAIFGVFAVATDMTTGSESAASTGMQVIGIVLTFLFYVITYTVSIFFNVALVGAALIRLDGGDPTVADGLKIARERFGKIVGYAVISATVGLILQWLRDRGFIGQIVASFTEFAWNVATFLVVPVLIVKDIGPWEAVKESTGLLKKTWGEQLVANFGIGTVFGLIFFLVIFGGGTLVVGLAGVLNSGAILVVGIIALIVIIMILGTISGALSGVYQAMLYRYAEAGSAPTDMDIELIRGAFVEKPKRKGLF